MIAIDLGSNTIRFLAVDQSGKTLWEKQFTTRTAENLTRSGAISQAALKRIAEAIAAARSEFDFSSRAIAAVATEAFRRAVNQSDALRFLRENCGVDFEVISPCVEAKLTASAAGESAIKHGLKPPFITLDIGGASSEIAYINGDIFRFVSLPIGIVTVAERSFSDDELNDFLDGALSLIAPFKSEIASFPKARFLIATSGVPTTLAAIKLGLTYETYDKKIVNGARLDAAPIMNARETLSSLDKSELERLTGKDRGDLVITGAAMLARFMRELEYETATVFDEGLREGVAANALANGGVLALKS
ncbi:MAG: hypothetical protein LBF86_03090 [Helicobacteraceae bacterium]|nr:hypothetical protein [Helicobacteraceae bacterium]